MELRLSEQEELRLAERAKSLGVKPEELARAAVVDLLASPEPAFDAAVAQVLEEDDELLQRLAQ